MKISQIRISNILGIKQLEFTPEGFNAISGPNGAGKTSILSAIRSALGQGHDATLLRKGEEKGEVVLVLDDGTEIHERVTAARTTRDVVKDGKKLTRPGDSIKALTDSLSVNPVEFLRAQDKERVKVLLDTMPIQLDLEKLSQISGVQATAKPGVHPLALIDLVRKQVYDDRTGTNRAIKEKEATINQLSLAMPEAPAGVEGDEDSIRGQIKEADAARDERLGKIKDKLDGVQASAAAKSDEIRTKLQEQIDAIKAEAQAKIDALRSEAQAQVDAIRADLTDNETRAAAAREKALAVHREKIAPLETAVSLIVADRAAAAKRLATQETINKMRDDMEALVEDAESQSQALDAIDAYKEELLSSMPIPGLAVVDGEVTLDGISFDRLNTATQVNVALQLAKLRAGELSICCLDGMELLDSEHLQELERQAEEMGLQVFVTRVNDEQFSISAK